VLGTAHGVHHVLVSVLVQSIVARIAFGFHVTARCLPRVGGRAGRLALIHRLSSSVCARQQGRAGDDELPVLSADVPVRGAIPFRSCPSAAAVARLVPTTYLVNRCKASSTGVGCSPGVRRHALLTAVIASP